MSNTNSTEKVTICYDVLNGDNERVRGGSITHTFDSSMEYIEMIDELLEMAWDRESKKSWRSGYIVLES